jgi:hypothetical protein
MTSPARQTVRSRGDSDRFAGLQSRRLRLSSPRPATRINVGRSTVRRSLPIRSRLASCCAATATQTKSSPPDCSTTCWRRPRRAARSCVAGSASALHGSLNQSRIRAAHSVQQAGTRPLVPTLSDGEPTSAPHRRQTPRPHQSRQPERVSERPLRLARYRPSRLQRAEHRRPPRRSPRRPKPTRRPTGRTRWRPR